MFFHSINFKLKLLSVTLVAAVLSQYGIPEVQGVAKKILLWSGLSLASVSLVQLGQDERLKMKVHLPSFAKPQTLKSKAEKLTLNQVMARPLQAIKQENGKTEMRVLTSTISTSDLELKTQQNLVEAELAKPFTHNSIVVCKKISAPRGVNDAKPYMVYSVYQYTDNFNTLVKQFCFTSSIPSVDGLFSKMLELFKMPTKVFKDECLRDIIAAKKKTSNVKTLNRM